MALILSTRDYNKSLATEINTVPMHLFFENDLC